MANSPSIRIAAAQMTPAPGDLSQNLRQHLDFLIAARAAKVQLLVFPELSINGYELSIMSRNVSGLDAPWFLMLHDMAQGSHLVVIFKTAEEWQGISFPLECEPH